MNCEWENLDGKIKCKLCGFIAPSNTINRNCPTKKEVPSIIQRGINLGKAVVNHISTGMQHCTDEQKASRFETCKSNQCGFFRSNGDSGICAHNSCGCYLRSSGKFMDKLSWAESKCPVGLWSPIEQKIQETPINGV